MHIFLNGRPADSTKKLKNIFYNIYKRFKIPEHTFPYVFLHAEIHENSYELKLHPDFRKFFFRTDIEK
jgi:hypothetical protein